MTRLGRIARNIVTNWLGFVVSAAITLLLTPIVLEGLGTARYGIWILTSSIVGYYGILDFGFRAGLTQYLTRYLSIGRFDVASEYLSSALVAMCLFGCFVLVLGVLGAAAAPYLFDIPEAFADEAFWCILIVGCGSALQFALFPFSAIFPAAERFDVATYIAITTRVLAAILVLLALRWDQGLIGVSVAMFTANTVDYLLRWRISRRIVPELRFARDGIGMVRLRDIFSFGVWNFMISLNEYAYQHAPNIIIATFLRMSAVGHYALATGMLQQISSLLMPVGQVMYPVAVGLHSRGDHDGLRTLYHDGTRLMMVMMISIVLVAGFFAEDFYRLWIGERYLDGSEHDSVALLLQVLLASTFTSFTANIGIEILKGAGRIRLIATILIVGSLMSIMLSFLLIGDHGLLGIAVAVVAASAIVDLIVVPILIQRIFGFSVLEWIRRAWLRPLLVGAVEATCFVTYRRFVEPNSWIELAMTGVIAGVVCVLASLAFGMSRAELDRFVLRRPRA